MSLSKSALKDAIRNAMNSDPPPANVDEALEALAGAIVDHIQANLDVQVPSQTVIASVTGGSGAPALGIKNTAKISCEVS